MVKALLSALPGEQVLYFGDTARLPYGSKTAAIGVSFGFGGAAGVVVAVVVGVVVVAAAGAVLPPENARKMPVDAAAATTAAATRCRARGRRFGAAVAG